MAENLRFPLESEDQYQGSVTFQVLEEIPPSITVRNPNNINVDTSENSTQEDVTFFEGVQSIFSNNLRFSGKTQYRLGRKAKLYLPQAFQFDDAISLDEFSLGRIGGFAEAAVRNNEGIFSSLTGAIREQTFGTISDLFNQTGNPDVARLAVARLAKRVGPGEFGAGVSSALQVSANPNKRVLFREVELRNFLFNFSLIPTSRREAEMITQIIKFFREELYPDDAIRISGPGGETIPIGYTFPNKFVITLKHKEKRVAHRILPSFLVRVQTNYNPNAMGFFEDGNFTSTEMSLAFRETKTLSKADVRDGGY